MEKIETVKVIGTDGIEAEHIIIDRGNGEFTSMLKLTYEAMQAEQSTPSV